MATLRQAQGKLLKRRADGLWGSAPMGTRVERHPGNGCVVGCVREGEERGLKFARFVVKAFSLLCLPGKVAVDAQYIPVAIDAER